jgi:hypothetical protein
LLISAAAAAGQDPICADRPGKSSETCTVPSGRWQVETGVANWVVDENDGERDSLLTLGETTVKYGLTDRSDLEIDVTPWQRLTTRTENERKSVSGFGDISILFKQRLTSEDSPLQLSLFPMVKVPTGKALLSNRKWEGGLLLPIGYAVPGSRFSIGLTPEIDWVADADGHGHHAAMVQVASLGWQVTDKLSLAGEIWHLWDWGPNRTVILGSMDGSIAYLVSDNLQLDAGANFGLNNRTPDVELYSGVSVRF